MVAPTLESFLRIKYNLTLLETAVQIKPNVKNSPTANFIQSDPSDRKNAKQLTARAKVFGQKYATCNGLCLLYDLLPNETRRSIPTMRNVI